MTERDIFFTTYTYLYSPDLLDEIYTKYRHISIIACEPISKNSFFDYVSGKGISLEQLNANFDDYTPMAFQKLSIRLGEMLQRWQHDPRALPFQQLYDRIDNLLNGILKTDVITV